MTNSKDLFDESTMSFGEHLESLRTHLWKAIIGLVAAVVLCLFFGQEVISFVRGPIDNALVDYNYPKQQDDLELGDFEFVTWVKVKVGLEDPPEETEPEEKTEEEKTDPRVVTMRFKARDMYRGLKEVDPELVSDTKEPDDDATFEMEVYAEEFSQLQVLVDKSNRTVALNVQEAFLTYLKVSLVAGFVLASPWIFYQLWLFVAAGLYPHERKYVHIFLPMSVGLFIGGAIFCFYAVFPFVLKFLLEFNKSLGVDPQIRLSEWVSFALVLPLMFGISFQLPLVMLFLERIQVFTADTYRKNRRMAVLVISIISMLLTPADPMSMMLMAIPLMILYEVGIKLCGFTVTNRNPFGEAEA
jgi:sec-independent protein translocase protein TatC